MAFIEKSRLAAVMGACMLTAACGDAGSNPASGTVTVTSAAATAATASTASAPTPAAASTPSPNSAMPLGAVAGMPDGFNVAFYRDRNPDVVAAKISLLGHYLRYGKREGRLPYQGAPAATYPAAGPLAAIDLSAESLWNYTSWMASEWASMGPIPFQYDHVRSNGADTVFFLDSTGEPELKMYDGGPGAHTRKGFYEADVTLPPMRDGLIVAPIWLYNGNTGDEIDFEFAGRRGLQISLHAGGGTVDSVLVGAGHDYSGERHVFGIKQDLDGGGIDMLVDGTVVKHFDKTKVSAWPSSTMAPILEMWAADPTNGGFVNWAGKWAGVATDETLVMTVHGYRYTPLT